MATTEATTTAASPTCPFCRSENVTTTSKAADDVYWRCCACGQIWNPSRLKVFRPRPRY